MPLVLVLENDAQRASGFTRVAPLLGQGWSVKTWADPGAMLGELDARLPQAGFIALEASIAAPVVNALSARKPACPVTLHWKTSTYDTAWGYFKQLREAQWNVELLHRFRDYWPKWQEQSWLEEAQRLMFWRTDTRANRAHAASCERLKQQFEGREAIYIEKYVRRIRVSHIRAHVDARQVEAYAEQILTPGLGVPAQYRLNSQRWRFGGGRDTRFSAETWSLAVQHVSWSLYFAPQVIAEVVRFAATLPPEEVYESRRLHELIWELTKETRRAEQPVFPG